jgi:death-on-curing protein
MVESALGAAINTALCGNGDVFDVAAAYAFHIAEAQAFLDGNKRTAIAAALAFLALNHPMRRPEPRDLDALYDAMIAIANRQLDKAGLAALLRRLFA